MQNQIKDAKDRTWRLAVTIGSVKRYEQATEIKVFAQLFALWQKHRDKDPLEIVLAVIADLFPGIEEAAMFVYECATVEGGDKPTFDDFCNSVSPIACGKAITGLTEQLQAFMPDKPKDLKESSDGGPLGP
jgi:hypothetical protein